MSHKSNSSVIFIDRQNQLDQCPPIANNATNKHKEIDMHVHESPEFCGLFWVVDDNKEVIEGPFFYAAEAQEWIDENE